MTSDLAYWLVATWPNQKPTVSSRIYCWCD